MLRNYLTVALRNLVANKLYSAINIGGLAVGLAACLVILLLVRDDLSYERFWPDAERIAMVETTFYPPGREKLELAGSPGPMKAALEKDFSSDIERVVRMYHDKEPVRAGDRQLLGDFTYVDAGFFDLFPLPMVAGERDRALADNASIVLSETAARKFFGDEPAVGQTFTAKSSVSGVKVFTVVGVFADLPKNTHLYELESIALFDTERYKKQESVAESWTSVNVSTYVMFRSAEARARVLADLEPFIDRNVVLDFPNLFGPLSKLIDFELMPIVDIHLYATKPGYGNAGQYTMVLAFAGIAALILIIACINFVNLATARAMKRAREVAVRKVVGATRRQLVVQHLGETLLTALVALVIAIALVEVSLAPFNAFVKRDLRLDFAGDPMLLVTVLGLIGAVGLLGGLYPAVYLSRFRPAEVLKANQSSASGSSLLRSGLVVFQFAISIALIVCTATIYGQTIYARTIDLGFERDDRLVLSGLWDLPSREAAATLKREVSALPGVRMAALSSDAPPLQNNNNTLLYPTAVPSGDSYIVETVHGDPDFFATYEIEPLAGRLFSAELASDYAVDKDNPGPDPHQAIVINRAFMGKLGATRPEEVLGKVLYEGGPTGHKLTPTTIVGVVPDLHLRSLRASITPMAYYAERPESNFGRLTVHVVPGRAGETLRAVDAIWRRVAPEVPIQTGFVDDDVAKQYDGDEQRGQIFAGFAVFAVLIACLGLFGLASFSAERRTKEIGMRKVMGASVLDIVRLLVWQFSRPVLLANLIAWPVSFWLMSKWLSGFRYSIELTDPRFLVGIFGGAGLLALAIAWVTIAGHAYKVARANPGRALRCE